MQIEKVMKALFVRKLYLWPRFEAHVKDALNDLPIEARHDAPVHLNLVISILLARLQCLMHHRCEMCWHHPDTPVIL